MNTIKTANEAFESLANNIRKAREIKPKFYVSIQNKFTGRVMVQPFDTPAQADNFQRVMNDEYFTATTCRPQY